MFTIPVTENVTTKVGGRWETQRRCWQNTLCSVGTYLNWWDHPLFPSTFSKLIATLEKLFWFQSLYFYIWNFYAPNDIDALKYWSLPFYIGTAVAQWLRCCATNRKVAGSIPVGVNGIFYWHNLYVIRGPCDVASHLKILIPFGTAMIIFADVKYARVSTSIPTVNMWCAHIVNPNNLTAIIAKIIPWPFDA